MLQDFTKKRLQTCGFFKDSDLEIASESVLTKISGKVKDTIQAGVYRIFLGKKLYPDVKKFAASNGDITKIPMYAESYASLVHLETLADQYGGGCAESVKDLRTVHDYMKSRKALFAKYMKAKDRERSVAYISMSLAWTLGVSRVIVTGLDFSGNVITWKKNKIKLDDHKFCGIATAVHRLAKSIKDGSLDEAMKRDSKIGNESPAVLLGIVGIGLLLFYFIRLIVYSIMHLRVSISDWLKSQAYFSKTIAKDNNRLSKEQVEKQNEYADKLVKLAEKIDVNLEDDDAAAGKMIEIDEADISKDIKEGMEEETNSALAGAPASDGSPAHVPSIGLNF